jgi:hypothetical protein
LLWRISCQTPSSFRSLNNHLLSKHLFFNSKTSTPNPPWSFGLQIMFHLVSLYFFLWPSFSQKKRDWK